MKMHKNALIAVVSLLTALVVLYLAFLFVLPNVINLNNYKKDIQKIVYDSAKLKIDTDNIKIVTTPMLHAGVKIDGLKLSYPDNVEFASVKNAQVRIKLIPLVFRTFEAADISADSPKLSLKLLEDGNLDFIGYVNKNIVPQEKTDTAQAQMAVKISDKLPKIEVKNYELSAVDKKTGNKVALKGDSFILDKAVINKHFRIYANGKILADNNENIKFNIITDSFLPVMKASAPSKETASLPSINFINEFIKFNPKADIDVNLKIREGREGLKIDGFLNADKLSAVLDSHTLPESYMHMAFKGYKINADSDIFLSEIEKASIKAEILNGKNTNIDLKVNTDKISFFSVQKFVMSALNSFNIKNDLNNFKVTGYIQSDFILKTDLKKFRSQGYLKAVNGSITHKTMPVNIKHMNADVDFSKNTVNIKKAGALVNGAQIDIKGTIDSKSNADISVITNSIPLNSLYTVFAPMNVKKSYDIQSGILTLNAIVKGKLENIEPKVSVNLNNLRIQDKINGIIISNKQTITNITASTDSKKDAFKGEVSVSDVNVLLLNPRFNMDVPLIKININPKNILITPLEVKLESSVIKVSGDIKNYAKKPQILIKADGSINALDLKKLLPQEAKAMVRAKGSLPLNILVDGDDQNISVKAQAGSDSQNYFSPVTVNRMINKQGLINAALNISNNTVEIKDIGLYTILRPYSSDFKKNLNNANEIVAITGAVGDLDRKVQTIKKLDISLPDPLLVSSPLMPKSTLKVRGRVNAAGRVDSPVLRGFFEIKEVNIPEFLTKIDLINVNFNDALISADIQNLNINGSPLNIKADASPKFNKIFVVNKMEVTSTGIDADKMMKAMESQPASPHSSGSSTTVQGNVFPVKIVRGSGTIDKLKSGTITASNISSDFTMQNDIIKLRGLKASAFDGTLKGDIDYNLATTAVKAVVQGKSMNADKAVTACAGLKDQVNGTLAFDADVSLKGMTYEQQMKTLKGKAQFAVNDGQLGSLGRFETFLQAGNLLSQSFVKTQIGAIINTIAPYNTGKIAYLTGELTFKNGTANLVSIKSSGPHMSLFITGQMNLLNNHASMQILGALSPQVIAALGPVGELSVEKIASYIPKIGAAVSSALSAYNTQANESILTKIPALTPNTDSTKAFKVVINGNLMNPPKAVKSFQWLNTAKAIQDSQKSLLQILSPQLEGIDTLDVPATKEELKKELKNQIQGQIQNKLEQNEDVQKFKENETVKNLGALYNFYKDKKGTSD